MQDREKYKVGLVQMSMGTDLEANLKKAVEFVREAAGKGARVICLPEMFRSQYFCQNEDADLFDLAEPIEGPSVAALAKVADENGVTIIAPIFEERSIGLYHNSLVIIKPGEPVAGVYRKMHIPDDPAYYEKFYFAPGDLGFKAFDTAEGRIGTLICWDQWYPEGARLTSLRGAEILFYPTAIGWHPYEKEKYGDQQRDAWRTIQRSHSIANGVYVAGVNRVGLEVFVPDTPGIQFWGSTFLSDPFGVIIAEADTETEQVVIGEVDPARIEEVRRGWPFLRDRRIDAYGEIAKRFID
ncbi:MAG: carbon-nitrogen hydrolase [Pyrinomonadaceae bacterium]|nr:carbon-nitrogen hydrolase [Blastocatellia bacterium]MCW5954945.1 carbon-nitrogen hydrolase [Pyrinomonadaceae bacterium]